MRLLNPLAVFVVAILLTGNSAGAQQAAVPPAEGDVSPISYAAASRSPTGVNGYDQYRQSPDPGSAGSPAHGFKHFAAPLHAFTTWYRPRAATLTRMQRCAPDPFRPRGFGHLFARQCDPFRMDYTPHTLSDAHSTYGPSYLLKLRDPRCEHCDCQ